MLRQLISYPKIFFRSLDLRSQISKRIMWIISKSHREKKNFFDIFAIHSSSRHEKCCQISVRLFSLFRGSIYQQCIWQVISCFNAKRLKKIVRLRCGAKILKSYLKTMISPLLTQTQRYQGCQKFGKTKLKTTLMSWSAKISAQIE